MNRATQKDERGRYCLTGDGIYSDRGVPERFYGDDVDRLAAYEDTGVEPENALSAMEMAKVACSLQQLDEYKALGDINRLRELVEADRDGRCFSSPVKIGDHVFDIDSGRIDEWEVTGFSVGDTSLELYCDEKDEQDKEVMVFAEGVTVYAKMQFPVSDVGDGVYLTRESAEAALKKKD